MIFSKQIKRKPGGKHFQKINRGKWATSETPSINNRPDSTSITSRLAVSTPQKKVKQKNVLELNAHRDE